MLLVIRAVPRLICFTGRLALASRGGEPGMVGLWFGVDTLWHGQPGGAWAGVCSQDVTRFPLLGKLSKTIA